MSRTPVSRSMEFLHDLRMNCLGTDASCIETTTGTIAIAPIANVVKVEVFDRLGQGYANIQLSQPQIAELIKALKDFTNGIPHELHALEDRVQNNTA